LKGNNLPARNNNFNNLSPPPPANLFNNIGGFNSLSNNNNLLSGELNLNITALVNVLTGMNLIRIYYLREGSFIKLTEFGGIKMEDPNE